MARTLCLLLTEWEEFRVVDWERVRGLVVRPLLLDGRNLFSQAELASRGFQYIRLGRNASAEMIVPASLPVLTYERHRSKPWFG